MPILLIHGGAGRIEDARLEAYARGLRAALDDGWEVLSQGGSALDAVVRAVATMEADPEAFNAGVGASLTRDGTAECDACVVDGRDGRSGAVAVVTRARSPVALARQVMESSPHVLIAGPGADALVASPIENSWLHTEYSLARLERWRERARAKRARARGGADTGAVTGAETAGAETAGAENAGAGPGEDAAGEEPTGSATVGAVALDGAGALAAATSTGGLLGQWPGRVGDAAMPGAGTFADARVAVSTTGKGEAFLRAVTAKTLAERLAAGASLRGALQLALDDVNAMGGDGGLIVVLADGRLGWAFDTSHLALAWRRTAPADATTVAVDAETARAEADTAPAAAAATSAVLELITISTDAGIVTVPADDAP